MPLNPTSISPLQLKTHAFPVVSIQANPTGKTTAASNMNQQVACVPLAGVPNNWNLQLQISLHSADPANPFCYEVEIVSVGVVEVSGDMPPEKREAIAAVNGLSLLYSACREMLINVTARSLFGAFTIPTLNFQRVIEEAKQNSPAIQKQPESASPPEVVKT